VWVIGHDFVVAQKHCFHIVYCKFDFPSVKVCS
jgi:hypothetical protein